MPPPNDLPASAKPGTARPSGTAKAPRRRGGRRSRGQSSDGVRYFVGQPANGDGKPTLEQELASEPEALVIAFKSDSRVYFVSEYRVTQRIERGEVRLEKEPASAGQRISSINES